MNLKKRRPYGVLILLALLLFCQISLASKDSDKAKIVAEKAESSAPMAPNFSLPGLSDEIQLSSHRGNIVYVDFWASWCAPCKKSFSWMNAMQDRYGEQGLNIIAINLDASRKEAESFLEENPAQFSIAFDPQGSTAELYEVQGMPSSYLIGPNGEIAYRHLGFRPADKRMLETAIEHLVSAL